MFQFRRFPSYTYVFSIWWQMIGLPDCSIRKSADHHVFAIPRSLSQLITSFIGSQCQGIRPAPFLTWPFLRAKIPLFSRIILSSFSYLSAIVVFYPLTKIKLISLNFCKTLLCFCLPLLSRLIQFSRFSKVSSPYLYDVVGSNGFEPSTSRLSGARSSLLSYEPMYHWRVALVVEMKRFELSTSCVQGRRSPNWATPPCFESPHCFPEDPQNWTTKFS